MIAATEAPVRVEITSTGDVHFSEFLEAVEACAENSPARLAAEGRLFQYLATRATLQAETAKAQEIGARNRKRSLVGVGG